MPAKDQLYADLASDARRRALAQQKQSPRAFDLRTRVSEFYHDLPLGDRREPLTYLAMESLNLVLDRGDDIDAKQEASIRESCGMDEDEVSCR